MRNQPETRDRTPADTILTTAMAAGIITMVLLTAALLQLGAPAIGTLIGMSVFGGLWVFTITPHLVALWLDCSVDSLLGVTPSNQLDPSSTHSNETDHVMSPIDPADQ